MSDTSVVSGSEFIRKVQGLAHRTKTEMSFVPQRGKGSHGTLYYGEKLTVVCSTRSELKTGTMHMLRQLGINPKDF